MVTSAVIHYVFHLLNIPIDIREVCVFLAPLFSSFTVIITYLFTKEVQVYKNSFEIMRKLNIRFYYVFNMVQNITLVLGLTLFEIFSCGIVRIHLLKQKNITEDYRGVKTSDLWGFSIWVSPFGLYSLGFFLVSLNFLRWLVVVGDRLACTKICDKKMQFTIFLL